MPGDPSRGAHRVTEQLLAQEAWRLEAKRRDIDRELETLQALLDETAGVHVLADPPVDSKAAEPGGHR